MSPLVWKNIPLPCALSFRHWPTYFAPFALVYVSIGVEKHPPSMRLVISPLAYVLCSIRPRICLHWCGKTSPFHAPCHFATGLRTLLHSPSYMSPLVWKNIPLPCALSFRHWPT